VGAARLAKRPGPPPPRRADESPASVVDLTPQEAPPAAANGLDPAEVNIAAGSCATSSSSRKGNRHRVKLIEMRRVADEADAQELRRQRGKGSSQARVVFHDGEDLDEEARRSLAHISLPLLYNPLLNGLEDSSELSLATGTVIAQRYRVVAQSGKGTFSRVVQCLDLRDKSRVSVKVLRNDKDCIDQGLGEVRLLARIAHQDAHAEQPLVRLLDYFYHREHLLIVTELLRDSLFNFYRYLIATEPLGHRTYFTPATIGALAAQLLGGVAFLHHQGITHCDLKPENVCLVSASRRRVKIIDFGSSVLSHDCHNSYVQSRWYRAPEVMLGLPWGPKVDVWGIGTILAELVLGYPIFHGQTVEAVLGAHAAVLGYPPEHMLRHAQTVSMYYMPSGRLFSVDPPGAPPGQTFFVNPLETSLRALLKLEDDGLADLLASLLTIDPAARPTAAEALRHPWLAQFAEAAAAAPCADGPSARRRLIPSLNLAMCAAATRAPSTARPDRTDPLPTLARAHTQVQLAERLARRLRPRVAKHVARHVAQAARGTRQRHARRVVAAAAPARLGARARQAGAARVGGVGAGRAGGLPQRDAGGGEPLARVAAAADAPGGLWRPERRAAARRARPVRASAREQGA
jgi:serine/threonine protein kinase